MTGYTPCPFSLEPDERGEVHPHDPGNSELIGLRICEVCGNEITAADLERVWRAEARAILARVVGREYWREPQTSSDPQPGSGGSTPPGGPRAERPGERER